LLSSFEDNMKNFVRPAFVGVLLVLGVALVGSAQLQQSGGPGSSVSINAALPAGTNVIGHVINDASAAVIGHVVTDSGSTTAVTGNVAVTGTFFQGTQPVSGTFWQATQPVSGTVTSVPKTACGTTIASQALAAVPTSSTAVFTSTTCVTAIVMNNTNSSSVTVTVTDNAGTPINDILTFSIPANSQLIQPLYGVAFSSGLKWSASGAGVTGGVIGFQ
jgi:hypothetical protein